jgi:threonine dehydrogenase-like Zn-dependent dehydrogenase
MLPSIQHLLNPDSEGKQNTGDFEEDCRDTKMSTETKTTNRSVVWVAPKKLEVQHRDVPEVGEDDVLVEIMSTGICGSDAHVWASNPATPPPVLGHESAGIIAKVGAKVTGRSVGMRVAVEPGFACMKYVYILSNSSLLVVSQFLEEQCKNSKGMGREAFIMRDRS